MTILIIIIIIAVIFTFLSIWSHFETRKEKRKHEEYRRRLISDPDFRIQEELKDYHLIAFPNVWLLRQNDVPTVKIYKPTFNANEVYYEGPIESDRFRQIENALAKKGIVRRECSECGIKTWSDLSWPWTGYCSDECRNKCYSRDLRHQARTSATSSEHIPLFEMARHSNFMCAICGGPMDHLWEESDENNFYHTIDHIVPVIKGGSHTKDNVQVVHLICNEAKGIGPPIKITLQAQDIYNSSIEVRYDKDSFVRELRKHRKFP